jgi:hypothetical protein
MKEQTDMSIRRQLADDRGFAMAIAMGAIALITVVAIGTFFVASHVTADSTRVRDESRAFTVAQSGMDRELAQFNPAALINGSFSKTGSTPDGTYEITVNEIGGGSIGEYTLVSTGTSNGMTESVTMRFFYLDLWDMNIGAGESAALGGGSGWNGNASITGPLYIRGDFDWSANAAYERGPLFVRDGALIASGSGEIGRAEPIRLFSAQPIQGKVSNVYLAAPQSYSVPDIELPWVDQAYLDEKRAKAITESHDDIMGGSGRETANIETGGSGSPSTYTTVVPGRVKATNATQYYKVIDGNLTIDATSFGEWDRVGSVYQGTGTHDDFAFDRPSGTLYVEGTVFIDGNLTLGPNVRRYVGNGTLIVTGDVTIRNDGRDAARSALFPLGSTVSAENALGIVTPGNVDITGYFHGAIFANGTVSLWDTHSGYKGSILAGVIYGDKPNIHLETDPMLPASLPESMPAAGGGLVFSGVWTRQ